jgi:hypothetical protein
MTVAEFVTTKERVMGNDQQPGGEEPVDGGAAAFDFDGTGVRIDAENSPVPSAGEALKAAFTVCNRGTAAGTAHVTIKVDGQDSGVSWDSPVLQPRECAAPDGDGYVHGIPGQTEGFHDFEAVADPPGASGGSSGTNTVDIGPAESNGGDG